MSWQAALVAAAFGISLISLLTAWTYLRRLRIPRNDVEARVTLLMAITGQAAGLPGLLEALDRQTLRPRRLLLAIESADDPAFAAAEQARGRYGFPIEIVLAKPAVGSSQKCANLTAALGRIDADDQAVVFLDGDILPPAWWLAALVSPLQNGVCELVTGYRWPMIEQPMLGAHLVAAIDRAIALLPRLRWARAAWGGTLAISGRALPGLDLLRAFARTLSDDLTIGAQAASLNLRVLWRSALLVPTPLIHDVRSGWRFGRRQYQIIRLYRPELWVCALFAVAIQLSAWSWLLAHVGAASWPPAALATLLCVALTKQIVTQAVGRRLGFIDSRSTRAAQFALTLAKPLVDAFHLSMILGAMRVRTLSWAHLSYSVRGPSDIAVKSRVAWPQSAR